MQNQRNHQNFNEEQEYSGIPIPVGQPVQYEMQQIPPQQAPYFQQPIQNPYQANFQQPMMPMQPVQAPMVIQPYFFI